MPTIKLYTSGKPETISAGKFSNVVEIVLDDNRTAQMYFREDGELSIRAWGNVPAKLGNGNDTSFRCKVKPEEPTTCEICYTKIGECTHTQKSPK